MQVQLAIVVKKLNFNKFESQKKITWSGCVFDQLQVVKI
jgi:hypothetical protein